MLTQLRSWSLFKCHQEAFCCCCLVTKSTSNSFATPRTVYCQAPLSMKFPRQEYWSVWPFPSPGDLLDQGTFLTQAGLLHCRQILYHLSHQGSLLKFMSFWVDDAIQPSHPVIPFSSCPQVFPASGSFPVSQLFASSGQSIETSASASVLPMNIQHRYSLELSHSSSYN